MWFKNVVVYRLSTPFTLSPEDLAKQLAGLALKPCGGLEPFSFGWTPPLGRRGTELVHAANGRILLCACRQERLLPSSVVRDAVEERVAAIEGGEGRNVGGRERKRMRDDVTFELMPRAFTRNNFTRAYISPAQGWLVIDASTPKKAEEFLALLVHSVRGFAAEVLSADVSPVSVMTNWLSGQRRLPQGFSIQHDCELRDPADAAAVVRCQRLDLSGNEIRAHLHAHKQVQRLALGFEERLSFILGHDLSVKRMRFDAVEELDEIDEVDEAARFDANFAFMTVELDALIARLADVFSADEAGLDSRR